MKKGLLEKSTWDEIDTFNGNIVYRNSKMNDIIIVTIKDNKITHENIESEVNEKLKINPKVAQ